MDVSESNLALKFWVLVFPSFLSSVFAMQKIDFTWGSATRLPGARACGQLRWPDPGGAAHGAGPGAASSAAARHQRWAAAAVCCRATVRGGEPRAPCCCAQHPSRAVGPRGTAAQVQAQGLGTVGSPTRMADLPAVEQAIAGRASCTPWAFLFPFLFSISC